ncbi:hypothetical protein AXE65_09355 [Ventosimonas gracilis]|uniref:Serine peptidase n=1 Tax=Ventosimonas gracilis TaxID=1680762 RepID=A0A139SY14_9GAMM|nr:hypothetical protein [Ventosimonas gracilis]KXU39272.1 hypothetical protein AXE65_09355 [Ventosimonas gracilis]
MKVLMIHGTGQEDTTSDKLLKKWTESLHKASPGLLSSSDTQMAYYGKPLADWIKSKKGKKAVGIWGLKSVGIDIDYEDEEEFLTEVFQEAAYDQGVTEAEIIQAAVKANHLVGGGHTEALVKANHLIGGGHVVPVDNFIARRLVGLVKIVGKLSPAKGETLFYLSRQARAYLSSPETAKVVDDIVRPLLQASPQVLITHSLGSVVAFKLLREMHMQGTSIEIPLLITMGSPLGLNAFKKRLGPPPPLLKPSFVKEWRNFYDPSDFVALGKPLGKVFADGIIDDGKVNNTTLNAHGIIGYLPHKGVIDALKKVL